MEKQAKPKNKILKFLPKAASAIVVSFQNPPFSPSSRDKRISEMNISKLKAHHHAGRGFSGPIISIIPHEARRRPKIGETFETQEPTSPKVSCMGQIKHKKTIKKAKLIASLPRDHHHHQLKAAVSSPSDPRDLKKNASAIRRIFTGTKTDKNSGDASSAEKPAHDRAPSLSQMKRFSSRRESLPDFEWTAQVMPIDKDHWNYYSDEEREDEEEEEEEENAVTIPFSAPIMMVGGGVPALQPRKEINLWKRRTVAPPIPLQLNLLKAN